MKDFDDILRDPRIQQTMPFPHGCMGTMRLHAGKRQVFDFVATHDETENGGIYEHVSISVAGSNTKLPTWEEMCEVKRIFWRDDEEVHEVHPAAKDYLHGVGNMKNVLHLWRPVNGWNW